MDINGSPRIFEVLWALGAIGLGVIGIFFTDWYVQQTIQWSRWFYEKTKYPFYRIVEEGFGKPYMKWLSRVIGLVFVILGTSLLLGKWHTGPQ